MQSVRVSIDVTPAVQFEFTLFNNGVDVFSEIHICLLPDGCQYIIHLQFEFGSRDRHRPPPAGCIWFAQFHFQAGNRFHFTSLILIYLHRVGEQEVFDTLKFRFVDLNRVGRHFLFSTAIYHIHLIGTAAHRGTAAVHGSVTSTHNSYFPAFEVIWFTCYLHLFQEVDT